ncbi:Uma2 family endonuclease [Streptomyces niveiscabiei]|uniref:Uma2 family endonuclease n=1 Tax=Streptomyces niveiscabiei TaxID=164115 RepID=UPI0029A81EC3|nr:Uma2 family endonuclease [Streptomyces niveiscabiei]MDX3387286.1 Uma2 family endonuclease [Streptomyces niveiscabiei]
MSEGDYIRTDSEWDELVWIWERTEAPKGCKVEIVGGVITVTPVQNLRHQTTVSDVFRLLCQGTDPEWRVVHHLGLAVPSRLELYVPDIAVVPRGAVPEGDVPFVPAAAALLVGEVTSTVTGENDRGRKAAGYAEAGVPLYLLVDGVAPGGPTVTLYGEPRDGVYRMLGARPFGEPVDLPAPFNLTLGTSNLPVPMS